MVQSKMTSWEQQFSIVKAVAGITIPDADSFMYYLPESNMKKE